MNVGDRIQRLRKSRGISQEELADKIGVSRQAVSKWESSQNMPDLEKVIIMSDYFGVTTDYIIKGIESRQQRQGKIDSRIFAAVATAFNFMGLIISAAVWYEEQSPVACAIGLIFMVTGCLIFAIGMIIATDNTKEKSKRIFFAVNIWALAFLLLSFIYNILIVGIIAPYPIAVSPIAYYFAFWFIYITGCSYVYIRIYKGTKKL